MIRRGLAIAFLLCVGAIAVWAGSTPALNCGTGADVAIGGGKAWGAPANACAGVSTTATGITASGSTDYLAATNYGFAVPGGVAILGVQVTFKRSGNTGADITDNAIFLTKNGTVAVGVDHSISAFWPITAAASFQTYGATNDIWAATLAPADVNAATFGVLISALNNNTVNLRSATIYASPMITVTYSSPATGFSPGFIGTIVRPAMSTHIF